MPLTAIKIAINRSTNPTFSSPAWRLKPNPNLLLLHQIAVLFLATQALLLLELDVEAEAADFVTEHVERNRGAGFERVGALDS